MRTTRTLSAGMALLVAAGCVGGDPDGTLASGELAPGEPKRWQPVIATNSELSVLRTATTDDAELADAEAERLTDFSYTKISFPRSSEPDIRSETGVTVDMASPEPPVELVQVYRGLCNPQEPDPDELYSCWLFERYVSGQEGLSGQLTLRVYEGHIEARYDITWEGITDRFDGPPQWHRRRILGGGGLAVEE